jgi:hypothetical protein
MTFSRTVASLMLMMTSWVTLNLREAFPLGMAKNISKKKPEALIEVYQIKKSTN